MAGIVLESIAACRRATYCLRILSISQRPFVICPSVATQQLRFQRHSSDGPADDNAKDQVDPKKPIHLGQGQLTNGSDGSQVIAAPSDPKDTPGEKRTELPYEVRPEIPIETQPSRMPLEVKPPNPHPIICTTDFETLNYTDEGKGADVNIESGAKSYISTNDLLPPPVINLMDDQTPYPITTEANESIECPYISVDSDTNYPSMSENAFVNSKVTKELKSQGYSSNDSNTEVTQSQKESKDVQTPLTTQNDSKPNPNAPGSGTSLDLKVKPQEGKSKSQSSPSADNSELSSRPAESNAVGSGWSQGSSFDLPGEGKISGPETKVEPIIYSSAKDGYGGQNDQILAKDQGGKKDPTADKVREHVVDNEVIDQWVDKFKRLYMAENAAFGLDNEKENIASSDKKNSDSKDEKDKKHSKTMLMKDNKWVYNNKNAAKPSPSTTDESSPKDQAHKNRFPSMVKKDNKWVYENKNSAEPSSSTADKSSLKNQTYKNSLSSLVKKDNKWVFENKDTPKTVESSPADALPLNKEAQQKAPRDEKNEPPILTMVLKDNKWVLENKDTALDTVSSATNRSSHEGDIPQDIAETQKSPINKSDEQPSQNKVMEFKKSIENTEAAVKLSTPSKPVLSSPGDIEAKQEDHKDKKETASMVKINNVWVSRDKKTPKPPSREPTLALAPEGTLPSNIGVKQESPKEFKESKADLHASDKNAKLETSKNTAKLIPPFPGPTKTFDPEVTLPLNIGAKQESPTEFKALKKDLLASDKNASTSPNSINLILGQPPTSANSESESSESSTGDFQKSTEDISSTFDFNSDSNVNDDNLIQSSSYIKDLDHDINQTTEEIIAIFKKDELNKTEDSEILDVSDDKLDQAQADKEADDYFSQILDFEESTNPHVDAKAQQENQLISNSINMETSELDKTLEPPSSYFAEKDSSFLKAAKNLDSSEMDPESILAKTEQTESSQTEPTSMLPNDPISNEVSTSAPMEAAELKESEDLSTGLEVQEVKATEDENQTMEETKTMDTEIATEDENQTMEETKTMDTEIASTEEMPEKKKPQLEQGELSMKLLDRESAETPTSASEILTPAEKSTPAEKIPSLGAESRTAGEKNLIQKLFEKILGGRGSNDGKRQMSSYTIQRQLSTSCIFGIPPSSSPNGAKEFRQKNPVRSLVTVGWVNEDNQELKPGQEYPTLVLDFFAKNTKDLTEIKGGSPSCASKKKPPRELLREKMNAKKIKILGGSEECAKRMKRIKELSKANGEDCDRDHFSISQFIRQLLVQLTDLQNSSLALLNNMDWSTLYPLPSGHWNEIKNAVD